jgi:hypothetical protein
MTLGKNGDKTRAYRKEDVNGSSRLDRVILTSFDMPREVKTDPLRAE